MKNILAGIGEGQPVDTWREEADFYYWKRNLTWTKIDCCAVLVVEGKVRCAISFLEDEQCYLLTCMLLPTGEVVKKRFVSANAAKYECFVMLYQWLIVERPCPKEKCNGRIRLQDQKGSVKIVSSKGSSYTIWDDMGVEVWQCTACEQYAFDLSAIEFPTLPLPPPDK